MQLLGKKPKVTWMKLSKTFTNMNPASRQEMKSLKTAFVNFKSHCPQRTGTLTVAKFSTLKVLLDLLHVIDLYFVMS